MHDTSLSERYQRYKSGTKRVVQWLANTAMSYTTVHVLAVARTEQTTSAGQLVIKLSVRNLQRLAQEIAQHAHCTGEDPEGIDDTIVVLVDVIRGRKEFRQLWEADENELLKEDDQGHAYFIAAMHSILQYLNETNKDLRQQHRTSRIAAVDLTGKKCALLSSFQSLTVEGSSEDTEQTVPAASEKSDLHDVGSSTELDVELEQDAFGDKKLALFCYLTDAAGVRAVVRTACEGHRQGDISLESIGILVQAGIHSLRDASRYMIADFPEFARYNEVAKFLNLSLVMKHGLLTSLTYDNVTVAAHNASSYLCAQAWTSLSLLRTVLQKRLSGSKAEREEAMNAEKHIVASHPLARVLMATHEVEKLADAWNLAGPSDLPDRAMADYMAFQYHEHNILTLDLVTSMQIQLDVLASIGDTPFSHVPLLAARGMKASASRKTLRDMRTDIPTWLYAHDKACRLLQGKPNSGVQGLDDVAHSLEGAVRRLQIRSSLLANLPVLGSSYASSIAARLHADGVALCNTGSLFLSIAHLYRTCRSSGHLSCPWIDADFVIDSQGARGLGFVDHSGSLAPIATATSTFALAVGAKPRQGTSSTGGQAANRFNTLVLPEATHVPDRLRVASCFGRQYTAAVEASAGATLSSAGKMKAVLHAVVREAVATHPELIESTTLKTVQTSDELSLDQSLSVLASVLVSEEIPVRFDCVTLFVDLCGLFDSIRVAVQESLEEFHDIEHFSSISEPFEFVFEILRIAAKREALLLEGQNSYWPDVLKISAAIFEAHIETDGSKLHDEAKTPITAGDVVATEQWSESTKASAEGLELRLKVDELTLIDNSLTERERDLRATKEVHNKYFHKWLAKGINDMEVQASMAYDIVQQQKKQAEREREGKAGNVSASQIKNARRKKAKGKAKAKEEEDKVADGGQADEQA